MEFRDHFKIVTKFFKTILKNYECCQSIKNVNSSIEEWKIPTIISFISLSAKDNYSFHKNNKIKFAKNLLNLKLKVLELTPQECGIQVKENENLIQNLYQLFNMFHKNYPTQFINDDFSKCFIESLENIRKIDYEEFFFFHNISAYDKKTINDITTKNLASIMKCVELKEHL